MMIDATFAAPPVGAAAPTASSALAARTTAGTAGADFTQVLSQVAGDAAHALKTGEAAAISGIGGKSSVQDVVDAVMTAERSLQTTLAVRDKIVSAFQEISRMSI